MFDRRPYTIEMDKVYIDNGGVDNVQMIRAEMQHHLHTKQSADFLDGWLFTNAGHSSS